MKRLITILLLLAAMPLFANFGKIYPKTEIEIGKEGDVNPGEWTRKIKWYEILDVTSQEDND